MQELNLTKCKRCKRKLNNPESIKLGFGETCWKKHQQETVRFKKLFDFNPKNDN